MRRVRKAFVLIGITGIASLVLHCAPSSLHLLLSAYIPGDPWMSTARHWLVDVGVPASFVCKYISFLLMDVPTWVLLFPIMAGLGASRYVWAKSAAIGIALWVPIIDFLHSITCYIIFDAFRFAPEEMRMADLRVLFGVNTRVVPILCGILVCFAGFYLGKCMSMSSRKSHNDIHVEQGKEADL